MNDAAWNILWNLGLLTGFVGLPAVFGYFAGKAIEASAHNLPVPWRLLFCALGALVGGFAAWRTLAASSREKL